MKFFYAGRVLDHLFIIPLILMSYSFIKIIPILDMVAGDANCRLSVSKIKLTFEPKAIL